MKKTFRLTALCFAFLFLLSPILTSCSQAPLSETEAHPSNDSFTQTSKQTTEKETETVIPVAPLATKQDVDALEALYAGRTAYYGDIHCHPKAGVANDGYNTLAEWKAQMQEKKIDFVAFMNHRQAAHMYEADWNDTLFLGGTEPAATIKDSPATDKTIHYNMIFPDPTDLLEILAEFPEYNYTGGTDGIEYNEGTFRYPGFITARLRELIAAVKSKGGLFVHVHPKQTMVSENPIDYWFADYTGLEVFYTFSHGITGPETKKNYSLWCSLLAQGKRIWATAGSDSHRDAQISALTCVYSEEKKDDAILSHLAEGDFVCGFAGIRMAIGDTKMGSSTDFKGKRLIVSVDGIHPTVYREGRTYTIRILTDQGTVYTASFDGASTITLALDADENARFYRVEVLDEKRITQPIIAIGQPIWND